jgi:hypothetical protein
MTDHYIDKTECRWYGYFAAKRIRSLAKGLVTPCDGALEFIATEIDHATDNMQAVIGASEDAGLDASKTVAVKSPLLEHARETISQFSSHLNSQGKGEIQRKAFFKPDGKLSSMSRSAPATVFAIAQIVAELKKPGCPVNDAAAWQKKFEDHLLVLGPAVDHSHDAKGEHTKSSVEVEASRQAWLMVYKSGKLIVDGVLRLAGKRALLKEIFYDMAVAGNTQLTHDPAGTVEYPPGSPALK